MRSLSPLRLVARALVLLGLGLFPATSLRACEVVAEGTSIFFRDGSLGGDGGWIEVKNAFTRDGKKGENDNLAARLWEEIGCAGY